MVSGALPHEHGVHALSPRFDELDPTQTLRTDLPSHRFLGVSSNVYAGSPYGFDALFDEFVDVTRQHRFPRGLDVPALLSSHSADGVSTYVDVLRACLRHDHPGRSVANAVSAQLHQLTSHRGPLSWLPDPFDDGAVPIRRTTTRLVGDATEPVVLFLNLMEGHEPHRDTLGYDSDTYSVPRGHSTRDLETWDAVDPSPADTRAIDRYRDLYGASVEYLDRVVSELVDTLRQQTDRETTVVVTADHGENLAYPADDGHLGHVTSLTEGVLHVPLLLINPPDGYDSRYSAPVSHLDLRRLLAGLAVGETPDITRSYAPSEVIDITPGNEELCETDPTYWTRHVRCLTGEERKYEWDDTGTERVITLDPDRPNFQSATSGAVPSWVHDAFARPMPAVSATEAESTEADTSLDDAIADRLRDLGYR